MPNYRDIDHLAVPTRFRSLRQIRNFTHDLTLAVAAGTVDARQAKALIDLLKMQAELMLAERELGTQDHEVADHPHERNTAQGVAIIELTSEEED